MSPQTIPVSEYLDRKGIEYREHGDELITHCLFHGCDDDSKGLEAHLYINKKTSQYDCKKCGEQGNIWKLAEHFGDPKVEILLDSDSSYQPVIHSQVTSTIDKIWETASPAPLDFPYLIRKQILPHNARIKDNKLILPVYSSDGLLSSLQFIQSDGTKMFTSGGKTAGCFHIIGEVKDTICIAEGFATSASILESTGHAVAIAFSAGNLHATTKEVKRKFPSAKLIVCADSDETGLSKAKEVAQAIGTHLAVPKFDPKDLINNKIPTDFNDLCVLRGSEMVRDTIALADQIKSKYQFTSLCDLLEEPDEEVDWIVDELLPQGGFSIIVAKPKVGKSTLARQLALSVACGSPFLSRSTSQGRVLYVSLEEKRNEVRNHFRLLGATGTEDIGVYVDSTPEDAFAWLKREIEQSNPVLVIIDTLFRFTRVTDVNDYAKMINALDPLLSLARSHSVHLMAVHHARKGEGQGADTTLGSTAIFGSVDTAMVLKRTESKRTIETQQRYGEDMEPTVLVFNPETKRTELGETKQEDDVQSIQDEMVVFIENEKEPVKEDVIVKNAEGRTKLKRKALRNLVAQELVVRIGGGRKNDPYLYSRSPVPAICMEQEKLETQNEIDVSEEKTDQQILNDLGL